MADSVLAERVRTVVPDSEPERVLVVPTEEPVDERLEVVLPLLKASLSDDERDDRDVVPEDLIPADERLEPYSLPEERVPE